MDTKTSDISFNDWCKKVELTEVFYKNYYKLPEIGGKEYMSFDEFAAFYKKIELEEWVDEHSMDIYNRLVMANEVILICSQMGGEKAEEAVKDYLNLPPVGEEE